MVSRRFDRHAGAPGSEDPLARDRRGAPPSLHLRLESLVVEGVDTSGWGSEAHDELAHALHQELVSQLQSGSIVAASLQAVLAEKSAWHLPAAQLPASAAGPPGPRSIGVALARSVTSGLGSGDLGSGDLGSGGLSR
ncbi:MAG: hypothetical protein AAGD01_16115 [Acidobacteriota bacterium]